jgi:molecular chaperone GrpE (heat shock protein)
MKLKARAVITALGRADGNVYTVFDNAQNVHNEQVEESVAEVLEFFAMLPLHMIDKTPIEFEQVKEQILDMIKKEKEAIRVNENGKTNTCVYCDSNRTETLVIDGTTHYCSQICVKLSERQEKIELALKRIHLDRARYSKFNNTLSNILLKVWSYMMGHENEEEMRKRMLEELEEMSATCSTGFASRLINVISGFGEFNIRISWEDQIIANFSGRLNAFARRITEETSENVFFHDKLHDVVSLWLNQPEQSELYKKLRAEERWNKISELVDKFLETDREDKIRICIDDFAEAVLNEMMVASSEWSGRQHFSLFFRSNISGIREEMYQEFKDHLDDTSFDLYIRKAIMSYEGVV